MARRSSGGGSRNTSSDKLPGVIDLLPELYSASGVNATTERVRRKAGPVGSADSSLNVQLQKEDDFRKVYKAEQAAREYYAKGMECLKGAQRDVQELPRANLPITIKKLKEQVQNKERTCHNHAKMVRKLARELKEPRAEGAEETVLDRLRMNLGDLLEQEANHLSDAAVDLNQGRKDDETERLRKLLPYAYPNATPEDIDRCLVHPEVAEIALLRGAQKAGTENLNVMVARLESSKECLDKRVEDESIAIEMLFGKFDQIVENQENQLGDVENDVIATLEETEEAIQNLKEARSLKVGNSKRKCCCYFIFIFLGLYLFWWFFGNQIMGYFNMKPEDPMPPPPEPTAPTEQTMEPILGDEGGNGSTVDKGAKSDKAISLLAMHETMQFAVDDGAHFKRRVRKARRFMA